jgi:hypothetical protein
VCCVEIAKSPTAREDRSLIALSKEPVPDDLFDQCVEEVNDRRTHKMRAEKSFVVERFLNMCRWLRRSSTIRNLCFVRGRKQNNFATPFVTIVAPIVTDFVVDLMFIFETKPPNTPVWIVVQIYFRSKEYQSEVGIDLDLPLINALGSIQVCMDVAFLFRSNPTSLACNAGTIMSTNICATIYFENGFKINIFPVQVLCDRKICDYENRS